MKNDIIKHAFINASLTALYIIGISSFLFYVSRFFDSPNTVLIPIMMLSLFVFSAALTGSLIFGRPILWYLEGKKEEAVFLLIYTLGIFLVITLLIFSLLLTLQKPL